jgi:hypothetical protein
MTIHHCKHCNYSTVRTTLLNKHLLTQKHKNNILLKKNVDISNNTVINKIFEVTTSQNMKIDNLTKQNDELKKKIDQLERVNNENTHKIVKEARTIKKSILSVLNSDFKDTPSIDYIKEDEFRNEFEEEYKLKLDDKDNKIFMRIFSDYKKKKLVYSISNVIVRIIKKEDQKKQSVFNIDASRGNYATKIQDIWHNDKKGMHLKKYTIDVITKYMMNIIDIYRFKLIDMYNENKTKKNISVTDYIMEYQGLIFDINSFLTNPNTHKKIIIQLCPELTFDENLLE